MGRPHQFCARAASRSSRDTRGLEPGAFFIENLKWSPDAKWAGFCFQVAHSSLVAQPAISRSAAPARGRRPPVPRMCQPPQRPDTAMLLASRRLVNSGFVLDSPVSSSRRFAMLTIHALPAGLRRPILGMAFSGWNDAAEAPTTPARPVRLVGGATDAELAARLGVRPTKYEGPTGIVGVLNTICREQGFTTASLWANVPHYISGIENPKATLALVRRVLPLLGATL